MDLNEDQLRRLVDERARAILREERDAEAAALEARRMAEARADEAAKLLAEREALCALVLATRDQLATAQAAEERGLRPSVFLVPVVVALAVLGLVGLELGLDGRPLLVLLGILVPLLAGGFGWVLRRLRIGARIALDEELARAEEAVASFDRVHAPPPASDEPYR